MESGHPLRYSTIGNCFRGLGFTCTEDEALQARKQTPGDPTWLNKEETGQFRNIWGNLRNILGQECTANENLFGSTEN